MARHDIELMEAADLERERTLARSGAEGRRGEIERAIDLTTDEREKVDAVNELGELVRGHLELEADRVPAARFEAMWREIDKVVVNSAPKVEAKVGLFTRVSRWFDRHRSHVIVGAVSAGAVAAFALVIGPTSHDNGYASGGGGAIEVRPASLRSAPTVESLDTPNGTSSILEVDDEDGHAAVIWVTPQDTVEGI